MINPFQNAYNYVKYGKVVYKSSEGEVIRKKLNYKNVANKVEKNINTTKTFFNKEGKITNQLERNAYISDKNVSTTVIKDTFDTNTGLQTNLPRRSKNYSVNKEGKRIVDYTKNKYDYAYRKLPDGRTEYTIYYPEVTVIDKVNNKVTTATDNKTYIE